MNSLTPKAGDPGPDLLLQMLNLQPSTTMSIEVVPTRRPFDGRTAYMWQVISPAGHVIATGCELSETSARGTARRSAAARGYTVSEAAQQVARGCAGLYDLGTGGKSFHSELKAMIPAAFTAKLAALATDDLLQLIRRMINEEIFNACFDAAVDEACRRDENLAVTIEAMWA